MVNGLQHTTLALTWSDGGPIRSIGWSCQALAPIYFFLTVVLNLHLQQVPNTYQLVARRRWLRVSCVKNRYLTSAENLKLATARKPTLNLSILVAYPPSQPRRMGYPTWFIHNTSWTPWWVEERRASEKYMASLKKKNN